MYEFTLTTFDKDGNPQEHLWKFNPVDREPGFDIIRQDKARATGSKGTGAFSIKEVWAITLGAGSLLFEEQRIFFLKFITANRIVWKRTVGHKVVETEFELESDVRILFEYLQDRRSLKRKTFVIVEKEPNYYDSFDEFYDRYTKLIVENALW